jgi:hypothetical protein
MIILVTLHHAQPIVVQLLELQSIFNFQILLKKKTRLNLIQLQKNIMFKSEAFMVNILKLMMEYLIFQTEGG